MSKTCAPIQGRAARAASRGTPRAAVLVAAIVALCLALAACPAPGGAGGDDDDGTAVVAKNSDASSWGTWLINGSYEWYLSSSHLIKVDRYAEGTLRRLYKIDKIDAAPLSVIYEKTEVEGNATLPGTLPLDLAFSLTRLNADIMKSPVQSPTTASAVGKYYYMLKTAGATARATGLAATGTPDSRALIPAAGISLTIRNTLNSLDSQTVTTTAAGEFPLRNAIPGDSYELSFPGAGKPPIPLTIGYDGQKVGTATDPGTLVYSLKHQGVQGEWASSSSQRSLPYFFVGEEISGLTTEVQYSGPATRGMTGWAEWRYMFEGVPFVLSTTPGVAQFDYFELPHESLTMHDTMSTRIPASFVTLSDLSVGADYVEREIDLGAWVRSTTSGPFDLRIWQDSLWLRFYASSFQLGAVCDSSSAPKALLTLPDQRSFDFGLEFYAFSTDTRVPVMAGNYYIAVTWSGSGTESYTLGPGLTFPINASDTSGLSGTPVEEPVISFNDSKSSATKIDFGTIFRGTVSASDPVDFLYFVPKP